MCLFNIDSSSHHSNTTTIVGVTYDGGVILGSTDTITQLTANIFSCHCVLEAELSLEDARNFILDEEKSTMVTAETIGTMLSVNNNKTINMLETGVIIGGAKRIYEISLGGIVTEKSNFGVGGYGVAYLNNLLEKEWQKGMKEEEAEELVLKILSSNISLGGVIGSCGIQTLLHPYDTLTIRQQELDLKHVIGERQCVRARLSFSRQRQ
ncbi:unnamed protein product [Withania somnifera]